MATAATGEKTEEELRKEIEALQRQKWEISERLRDPRGLRRGGLTGRNFVANGNRQRGFIRPADRNEGEDLPPAKRRLSSAVVKVEDGEIVEVGGTGKDVQNVESAVDETVEPVAANQSDMKPSNLLQRNWSRKDSFPRSGNMDFEAPVVVTRVLPKNEDPSLVNRNKRMLGQLLGTLEKFRNEDKKLSGTEAFMRRSDSLQRAEQRAREESERLRQEERQKLAEKRKRDLTLRARVDAKAEEKKLELLFLRWTEHYKKLCNFHRTKAEPPIYYTLSKPLEDDASAVEQQKEQEFQQWKAARREELSEYQKQIGEQSLANVEKELERWQNARKARNLNNNAQNLQETMDQELETHRLEHGPKTRKIPGGSNEDEDDVEDINVGEDDMLDDVLEVDENSRRGDETAKVEAGNSSPLVEPDNVNP